MEKRERNYLLHIDSVYKQYGQKVILDNIDLSVDKGEFCTVVGPSGCGKSTLLRLILGQEFASEGALYIDGKTVGGPDTERGIVFQRYSLFPNMTVLGNVMLGLKLSYSWLQRFAKRKEHIDQAMEFLQRVGLQEHAHKFPHELSGGMKQRVAIAQALIMKPKILLMDEPFGALDPQTREDMQLFILELWEKEQMTIFFVTHDLEEAVYLGTRIFVLSQYYTDDRGQQNVNRGAKIVADHSLKQVANASSIKHDPHFVELIESIRKAGFDSDHIQHVKEFDLQHPDAFQTLTQDEHSVS